MFFLLAHLSLISDHLCGRYLPAPVSHVSFISRQINLEASVSLMKHETDGAPIRLQRGGISPIGEKKATENVVALVVELSCIPA